jgi:uncharacterized membrane protein YfbV (UPF0208 family)
MALNSGDRVLVCDNFSLRFVPEPPVVGIIHQIVLENYAAPGMLMFVLL